MKTIVICNPLDIRYLTQYYEDVWGNPTYFPTHTSRDISLETRWTKAWVLLHAGHSQGPARSDYVKRKETKFTELQQDFQDARRTCQPSTLKNRVRKSEKENKTCHSHLI